MPVISFANPKGGAGKSTCALLLATQLAENGASVAVIDADPERWISQWAALPGCPDGIRVVNNVTEDSIIDQIEAAASESQFIVVDLEGTASLTVASAISMSDLVMIPMQGSALDAKGGAKIMRLIRNQARLARHPIPHAVVMTRTSAAVTSRALRNVRDQLSEAEVDVLQTGVVERAAFRDLFDYGGTLADLDPKLVSNVERAVQNARDFAGEVLSKLKSNWGKT